MLTVCAFDSKLMPEVDYAVLSEFYDFILQQENTKVDIIGKCSALHSSNFERICCTYIKKFLFIYILQCI